MKHLKTLTFIIINLGKHWHKPKLAREIVFYASQACLVTMHFRKLHRVKQKKINFVLFRGPFKILKSFANLIMHSMCTLLLEIFLSRNTVFPDRRFCFFLNVGMLIETSLEATESWTLKPLSDITESPGSRKFSKGLRFTSWRSLAEPL